MRRTARQPPPILLCKVLVVGNAKCGKTSLIRRFSKDSFDSKYDTTVGVDFVRKDLEVSFQNQRVDGEGGDVGQQAGGCECGGGAHPPPSAPLAAAATNGKGSHPPDGHKNGKAHAAGAAVAERPQEEQQQQQQQRPPDSPSRLEDERQWEDQKSM